MKVLICGAGQVGFNIARYLAGEGNDVTVVDQNPALIRTLADSLDVNAIVGQASNPDILERAGAEATDILIAVTLSDEVNMVACQIAHSLFGVTTKVARIRNQSYLQASWSNLFSRDNLPIDVIISPEVEIARAVTRRFNVPGAIDVLSLANDRLRFIGLRCTEETPVIHTPLRQLTQLFPELMIHVVGIRRDNKAIIPQASDQLLEGDTVYFVTATEQVPRAMAAFGHEEPESRRVLILGGGNVGLFLAQELERQHPDVGLKLIEGDKDRAEFVARSLSGTNVLNGDVLDPDILDEADISHVDTVIAVTNSDETNILASLLAKRTGCARAMTLVNRSTFDSIVGTLGIDVIVNPRAITVSSILHHVRRGRIHSAYSLQEDFGELIEADAVETAPITGKAVKDINLPKGVLMGAILRNDEVLRVRGDTVITAGDRIILFAGKGAIKKIEKLFSVRLEYF